MKQPHTEQTIKHTDDEQNTGNHKETGAADAGGADRFGGTRKGVENVEKTDHAKPENFSKPGKPTTDTTLT